MADPTYNIPENPEYKTEIRALKDTDPVRAETVVNPLVEDILENIHAVKTEQDKNYYTQDEIDNKFSTLESNIDWKESVNTFTDIAKTYPNPDDGWTVNVKDTDYTYRWTGSEWVAISANAIPIATKDVDGKMSKEQAAKLEGVAANANNYSHPTSGVTAGTYKSMTVNNQGHVTGGTNPTTLSGYGITDAAKASDLNTHTGNTDIHFTKAERDKLSGIAASANNYSHPKSGVEAKTYRSVTVNDQGHVTAGTNPTTLSGYGISDAALKTDLNTHIGTADIHFTKTERDKLSGISPSANNYSHPKSGVEAKTYRSVTVNEQGHVTGGTNPTTLSGYGISDAVKEADLSNHIKDTNVHLTTAEKSKLNGIAANANNYSHPTFGAVAAIGEASAKTLNFGSSFTTARVARDGNGHLSTITGATMSMPSAASALGSMVETFTRANQSGVIHFKNGLKICWGRIEVTAKSGTNAFKAKVTYPSSGFTYAPAIQATPIATQDGLQVLKEVGIANSLSDSVEIHVYRSNTTGTNVGWLAVGYKNLS